MASPIRSWRALYTFLGYPEPDDVELTRTVIITVFIAAHQDHIFDSESYYVRIPLDSHRSSVPVQYSREVMQRLRTILHPGAMANISVEILHLPAR